MTEAPKLHTQWTFWFGILYTIVQFAGLAGFGDYQAPEGLVELVQQTAGLFTILLRNRRNWVQALT